MVGCFLKKLCVEFHGSNLRKGEIMKKIYYNFYLKIII